MYIRVKRFQRSHGIKAYYYIVEGVRKDDHTHQRVVKYLGTVENIIEKIEFAEHIIKKKQIKLCKED